MTDSDGDTNQGDGVEVELPIGAMLLFLLIAGVIFIAFGYLSGRGFCKWTRGDKFGMYTLKNIANLFTGGILGIVMFFQLEDKDDKDEKKDKKEKKEK